MKNKKLLNICYKFFNRFITADELIKQLMNIDKTKLTNEDIKEINKMIDEIKKIVSNTPNKIDKYVIKKKETINNLINKIGKIPKDENNTNFLNRQLQSLKEDYNKEMDSHERWFKIVDFIDNNDYFNECYNSLSDYELLEFIVQNIQAPFPPQLNQNEFEKLVKVGIEKDKREWLWRLAFNYENRNINFDSIVNYYIKMKDGYYLAELISAVGESLDIDAMFDKIEDRDLINYLIQNKEVISVFVDEKQIEKLKEKI